MLVVLLHYYCDFPLSHYLIFTIISEKIDASAEHVPHASQSKQESHRKDDQKDFCFLSNLLYNWDGCSSWYRGRGPKVYQSNLRFSS